MKGLERPAATMKLIGGWLCLDFVNSAGGRRGAASSKRPTYTPASDKLKEFADLLAWGRHTRLLNDAETQSLLRESEQRPEDAAEVLRRAVALREAIYSLCRAVITHKGPRASDLTILNRELAIAGEHRHLADKGGEFVWEWVGTRKALDRVLWPVAHSAAKLLSEGDLNRLKQCQGESCGWLFADTSRNRSRQWCDMQDCGNLAKVRRFRSRLSGNIQK